jgi:hypothetical protein
LDKDIADLRGQINEYYIEIKWQIYTRLETRY